LCGEFLLDAAVYLTIALWINAEVILGSDSAFAIAGALRSDLPPW
jgi:hypothetical protein